MSKRRADDILESDLFEDRNALKGEADLERKNKIGKAALFCAGEIITFGFICLLQFFSAKEQTMAFVLTLLGMHVGIVCFILSKKLFPTKEDGQLKVHYWTEYLLLVPYLGLMLIAIFGVPFEHALKLKIVFGYTAAALIVSVINTAFMAKKLFHCAE